MVLGLQPIPAEGLAKEGQTLEHVWQSFPIVPDNTMKIPQPLLQRGVASEMQAERFCNRLW